MRKPLSSGQKWFLRPYFPLIRVLFLLRSGLRFLFPALKNQFWKGQLFFVLFSFDLTPMSSLKRKEARVVGESNVGGLGVCMISYSTK